MPTIVSFCESLDRAHLVQARVERARGAQRHRSRPAAAQGHGRTYVPLPSDRRCGAVLHQCYITERLTQVSAGLSAFSGRHVHMLIMCEACHVDLRKLLQKPSTMRLWALGISRRLPAFSRRMCIQCVLECGSALVLFEPFNYLIVLKNVLGNREHEHLRVDRRRPQESPIDGKKRLGCRPGSPLVAINESLRSCETVKQRGGLGHDAEEQFRSIEGVAAPLGGGINDPEVAQYTTEPLVDRDHLLSSQVDRTIHLASRSISALRCLAMASVMLIIAGMPSVAKSSRIGGAPRYVLDRCGGYVSLCDC